MIRINDGLSKELSVNWQSHRTTQVSPCSLPCTDYYLVLDFEATCDKRRTPVPQVHILVNIAVQYTFRKSSSFLAFYLNQALLKLLTRFTIM